MKRWFDRIERFYRRFLRPRPVLYQPRRMILRIIGQPQSRLRWNELKQIELILEHIETMGPGTHDDRLVYGRYLASHAVRLLRWPSEAHVMALRLLAHIGDLLSLRSVWEEAMDGFLVVENPRRLRARLEGFGCVERSRDGHRGDASLLDPEMKKWNLIYHSRRYFVEGDRYMREYRIRANGVLASIKTKINYSIDLAAASAAYRRCLDTCLELKAENPLDYPRHVADQARLKLWVVAICRNDRAEAMHAWRMLLVESRVFCERELPMLSDFPIYAAEFAPMAQTDREVAEQVSELLRQAQVVVDRRSRRSSSGLEESARIECAMSRLLPKE